MLAPIAEAYLAREGASGIQAPKQRPRVYIVVCVDALLLDFDCSALDPTMQLALQALFLVQFDDLEDWLDDLALAVVSYNSSFICLILTLLFPLCTRLDLFHHIYF